MGQTGLDFDGRAAEGSPILSGEGQIIDAQSTFVKKVHSLISANYRDFSEKDSDLLSKIFGEIQMYMRERNLQIVDIINNCNGGDVTKMFDFTGGIKIPKKAIESSKDSEIQQFFLPENGYVRESGDCITRGYKYYFNFVQAPFQLSGFSLSEWLKRLKEYCDTTKTLLEKFSGRDIQSLSDDEKLVLAGLIEHRKNTLFQLKNILSFLSSKDFFTRQVAGTEITSGSLIHRFLPKEYIQIDFNKEISEIDTELTKLTFYYGDIVLQLQNNYTLDFKDSYSVDNVLEKIGVYVSKIEQGIHAIPEKKDNETDENYEKRVSYAQKYKTKRYRRLVSKVVRPIREEDNFLNQVLTSFLISSNIPEENEKIRIFGMLYGGIEIPFIAKYVLNRFFGKKNEDMKIEHLLASSYANRTVKNVSTGENYIGYKKESEEGIPELQVVLDDNVWKGNTLNTIGNILSQSGPIIAGASQIGLRRRVFSGLFDGNNMIAFLSKISTASSVLPILKSGDKYKHGSSSYKSMIPYYLRSQNRLPNLRAKT